MSRLPCTGITNIQSSKKPTDATMSAAFPKLFTFTSRTTTDAPAPMPERLRAVPALSIPGTPLNDDDKFVGEQNLQKASIEYLHKRIIALEWECNAERVARQTAEKRLSAYTAEGDIARELEKVRLQKQELARSVAALKSEVRNSASQTREMEAARVLDVSLTPRTLIISKLLRGHAKKVAQRSDEALLQPCSPTLLTFRNLDVRLKANQAKVIMESMPVDDLLVVSCEICLLPKLVAKPGVVARVDEFIGTSRRTSCCSKSVCRQCLLQSVAETLETDWWTNLGITNWLRCPVSSCGAYFDMGSFVAVNTETLLGMLGDDDTARHLETYHRAEAFRAALRTRSPYFSNESLLVASSLQNHLVKIGRMHPLLNPVFRVVHRIPDATGGIPTFRPRRITRFRRTIRTVSVDHNGDSIDVPLFSRFLRKQNVPKSCIICTDDIFDIHNGSAEEWLHLCSGFHGAWMWDILLSPLKLELQCHHPIDFCTTCLRSHLKAQLEQHGRGGPDQLSCPSVGCGRKLSYQELQLYGDSDTFTLYDKYLQLDALSRLPNFRWCLRPECPSGQLYNDDDDDDDEPLDPHVYCNECEFEMCFVHSVPWHKGQSCAQYDSVGAHGDPEFQQTQDWIRENTKPCPGCSESIQKGDMCFHMTCGYFPV